MRQFSNRQFGHWIIRYLLPALLILFSAGCEETPTGRKQFSLIPDEQMAAFGREAFTELKQTRPVISNPAVDEYLHCITRSVLSILPESDQQDWEIVLFRDPSPNAFALPGRKIGIHTGMLEVADTQAELAAVLSHEIAHVLSGHANERLTQQLAVQGGLALLDLLSEEPGGWKHQALRKALGLGADMGLLLPFSRTHEKEADAIGLELMSQAGHDPRASLELWRDMERAASRQPVEFLSTHPSHDTRLKELEARMENALQIYRETIRTNGGITCR